MECQRFLLPYIYPSPEHQLFGIWFGDATIYPYHMTDYSFAEDLIYVKSPRQYFFILPRDKAKTYAGYPDTHYTTQTSSTILRNKSHVWELGGSKEKFLGYPNVMIAAKGTQFIDLRSAIINLCTTEVF